MRSTIFFLLAVATASLAGCGMADDASASADDEVEDVETTDSSLTTPPSGVGFVNDGIGHLKNGTGSCAYKNGTKLESATCANVTNQMFAYYKMSDGRYQMCVPDTLRYDTGTRYVWISGQGQSWVEYQAYTATCLNKKRDNTLVFEALTELAISYKLRGTYSTYAPAPGRIGVQSLKNVYFLDWVNSSLKMTRTSSGTIGLASSSGALNQQWTIY